MKHRLERVREVLKRELSEIVTRDMTFPTLVTVQSVDITPDLKNAHVFVSSMGTPAEKTQVLHTLANARKELQFQLSRRVVLKYTPHLHFKLDESIERGSRVFEILEQIDLPESPEESPEEENDER